MSARRDDEPTASWLAKAIAVAAVAWIGIAIWELLVWGLDLPPALLPSPRAVVAAAYKYRLELAKGTIATGAAAGLGLLLAVLVGSMLAIVFSLSSKLRLALFPYIVFLQTVPIVAIAPLLIIWSGYRFRTVLIVTVIVCLFPIINNVTAGLLAIDKQQSDMFRLYGAGKLQRLLRLQIPSAISYLMLGAKTSSGLAVIGAIVAEFFVGNGSSSSAGLGTLMTGWQGFNMTDALIAALFASTLIGLTLFGIVHLLSSTVLRRWTRNV
ncbi:ABC transporter permease [Stieleria varia]|uniref:Putative aliphatic sulfonates transport permease protein SsuC n=1 Tax=Stieleria varia TaxID=2528005 RepID=A0A5C6B8C9_9BACT|nr:ABC transporter permease subunit [Stieleria varia]TWU07691.1 putative aliphatic sulfonates transport permease protein SsuC [Stieleria varia]